MVWPELNCPKVSPVGSARLRPTSVPSINPTVNVMVADGARTLPGR